MKALPAEQLHSRAEKIINNRAASTADKEFAVSLLSVA
jgi:hypothetical protein